MSAKTYRGKVCAEHPELDGQRYGIVGKYGGMCTACKNEKGAKYRTQRAANRKYLFGKQCLKHPELNGKRYASAPHCVACKKESSAKKDLSGKRLGDVCEKHPELGGLRYKNNQCLLCKIESNRRIREANKRLGGPVYQRYLDYFRAYNKTAARRKKMRDWARDRWARRKLLTETPL